MSEVPIKLTPLYTMAQRLGAQFVEMAQWRFPERFGSTEAELASIRAGCGLADVTPHGKLQIEGEQAGEAVRMALKVAPAAIGSHAETEWGHLYRLRRDQFYLSTPPRGEAEAQAHLTQVIDECQLFVTVTDLTDGLADILIVGPAAPSVLSKLCGLDFHPSVFPNERAKQSSVAKTRQLILRRDLAGLPAFSIIGARSLAAYLWEALIAAGQEFGMKPVGVATLRVLEAGRV